MLNGHSLFTDLRNDSTSDGIALQEHWLTPSKLIQLNDVHCDYDAYGVSAMTDRLSNEVYRGRPFGGVAFVRRKAITKCVNIIKSDVSGRCLAISLNLNNNKIIQIVSVYFPCLSKGLDYLVELDEWLGFIEDLCANNVATIIVADMNFVCDSSHPGYVQCYNVLESSGIHHCDDLCVNADKYTYFNSSLGHASFIDHIFVSDSLRHCISNVSIFDSGANCSDHRPITCTLNVQLGSRTTSHYTCTWQSDK